MSSNMDGSKALCNKHRLWSHGSVPWCATSYVILGEFLNISLSFSSLNYKMKIVSVLEGSCEIKCRKNNLYSACPMQTVKEW